VLCAITASLELLASPSLTPSQFSSICGRTDLPASYKDLLLISAADGARRRGWTSEVDMAASSCSNSMLRHVWNAWEIRCASKSI
jgi:hypothetical protein